MKKRTYRSVDVKHVDADALNDRLKGERLAVGVDVAKEDFKAALMAENQEVMLTVKWKHPTQTRLFLQRLLELRGPVEVALEPSGTYGEALQEALHKAGVGVFQVSPKRVHDAQEVYDGVPSQHDPKCAAIIAKLHLDKMSRRWGPKSTAERELAAAIRTMDIYHDQYYADIARLEALLAKFWPEVTQQLQLGSATLWALLSEFGSPQAVSERSEQTRQLMVQASRGRLDKKKIARVIEAASTSVGVVPIEAEVEALQDLVTDIRRARGALSEAQSKVRRLSQAHAAAVAMGGAIGLVTAGILVSETGDPRDFPSAATYQKAMGLNLKECSSGKRKGELKITKRGSAKSRKYLYLAALRLIQTDPIVAAWYSRKVARDGGKVRMKAVVAVMRKLCRSMWHIARGERFNASKLFDVKRLKLDA